jgi:uncharacterized repeat protein (TIGR01451 family)
VANLSSDNVSVIDTATNVVTATVTVGNGPQGVAITPDGTRAYVVNFFSNNVSVIDTATNTVTTVDVGTNPFGVAITPDGAGAYVTNRTSGNVSVIDTGTNMVTATVDVGTAPFGVAITPDGARAYVTNSSDDTVSVIATTTNTVTATVTVGSLPRAVAITPASTTVSSAALSLTKVGPADAGPGETITYDLEVANAGPSAAAGVVVEDTLPPGATFVSATAAGYTCAEAAGVVSCTRDTDLAAGAGDTITIEAEVNDDVAGETVLTNTAEVSATTPDPDTADNSASASTTVRSAALSLTKDLVGEGPVPAGEELSYTITLTNGGPSAASDVSLVDELPAGAGFVSVEAPPGWACDAPPVGETGTLTCTRASVAAGTEATFTLVVEPSEPTGSLENIATVSSTTFDPDEGDNSSSATVEVGPACDVRGTDGDDRLLVFRSGEVVCGFGGDDTIDTYAGDNVIYGGDGDDVIDAGSGNDQVFGGAGNDVINGGSGDDKLDGGSGNDELDGESGRDTCTAGEQLRSCERPRR